MYKAVVIEGRQEGGQKQKRKYTLQDIVGSKNSFFSELKDAINNKMKISFQVYLRVKNTDKGDEHMP